MNPLASMNDKIAVEMFLSSSLVLLCQVPDVIPQVVIGPGAVIGIVGESCFQHVPEAVLQPHVIAFQLDLLCVVGEGP